MKCGDVETLRCYNLSNNELLILQEVQTGNGYNMLELRREGRLIDRGGVSDIPYIVKQYSEIIENDKALVA